MVVFALAKPRKVSSTCKEGIISEQLAGQHLEAKGRQEMVRGLGLKLES